MKNKTIRIGFDLDGVILYNPIRIVRPIVTLAKKILFKKPEVFTYFPKSRFEQLLWTWAHKTSFFVSPGFSKIKELAKDKNVEIYLITSRFSFLKKDLDKWLKRINSKKIFSRCFYNEKNERAHLYKRRLVNKLRLDFFIEDNFDIVNYLSKTTKTKIFWIYNILDKHINYEFKYPNLSQAMIFFKKKTKVLITTDYFYPHWTGLSKSVFNLTKSLEDEFDFTVLTVRYSGNLKHKENIGKTKIIRINPLFSFSRVKYSPFLVYKFISILKDFDVVFINSPCSNILPISLIAKLFKKKLLIFHQGDLILPQGLINRLIEKVFNFSSKSSFKLADKIATYSRDYAEDSRVLFPFLNKFNPLLLPILINKPNIIKKLKEDRKITFGFAGRFVEEKGFDILFEAIPQIVKKMPNARFVFAGETKIGYENFFEKNKDKFQRAKKWITLLGLLNDSQMDNFYKNIDFIIVPSRSDCFNYVQAEAMLWDKPSIISDIPGARYLVKETGFGVLFKTENPIDLTEKITFALKNKEEITKNYNKVLKILNKDEIARKIKDFIEK